MTAISARRPFWRARLLPLGVALLALNAGVFLAYTLPRTLQERTIVSRSATLRQEVDRQRRLTEDLRQRADTIRANGADTERLYREVLQTRRSALLPTLEDLEGMASEPGLRPGRRTFKPEEVKGAPLTRVVVTMPLRGTYGQLVGFLARVERSSRFLTVDRVSIRRGKSDRPEDANLAVELSAYFRADGEPPDGG